MTYTTKTKLCFAAAGALALLYGFFGAVMNGSFAVAGPVDVQKFHRNAGIFFWLSVSAATLGLACLILGVARAWRSPKATGSSVAQQAAEADGRTSS